MDAAAKTPRLSEEEVKEKKEKNSVNSDGLLINGGPSTDFFLKYIGKEETTKLFHEVLF